MLIMYDFEVFRFDWIVTFKELPSQKMLTIHNDRKAIKEYYKEHKNDLYIGFNSKRYDNLIYRTILADGEPYHASDMIINRNNIMGVYRNWNINKFKVYDIDLHLMVERRYGLKVLEGFMGMEIEEADVPWNLDRPLRQDELDSIIHYNRHDVNATSQLLEKFGAKGVTEKLALIKKFKLPMDDVKRTDQDLAARILGAEPVKNKNDEFDPYKLSPKIKIKNKEITDFYTQGPLDYEKSLVVKVGGIEHTLAFGGIHAGLEKFTYHGEMWQMDVSSYYPSLMVYWNLLPRSVQGKARKLFAEMYHDRIALKKAGKKKEANIYKLILNSIFGAAKDEFSQLYDPRAVNLITITGQLLLVDLIEKLEPYATLVQSNTDGILVIPHDKEKVLEVRKEWMTRTQMPLDIEKVTDVFQANVNNYVLVHEDGSVKVKGALVKQSKYAQETNNTVDNSEGILADAIVNYLVNGVSVEETIMNETDLLRFQRIVKVGKSYDKVWMEYGDPQLPDVEDEFLKKKFKRKKLYRDIINDNSLTINEKRNQLDNEFAKFKSKYIEEATQYNHFETNYNVRTFATLDDRWGKVKKIKLKEDGLSISDGAGLLAKHNMLALKDLSEYKIEDLNLDYQYYIDKAKMQIEQIIGEEAV